MSKFIQLSEKQWHTILDKIKQSYPLSVYLISWKMRVILGFTARKHLIDWRTTVIHLDFYDEKKRTMFLLKFGEYITNNDDA